MAYTNVVLLEVIFKSDLEHLGNEVGRVIRALCRRMWRLKHAKKALTLVVMTTETPERLLDRLRPALETIHTIEDYWCHMAPMVVHARNGEMDPTRSLLKAAWDAAREMNYPQHLKKA